MPVSVVLEQAQVSLLAEKICQARKLYGADSPYVLGLFAAFEWVAGGGEAGEGLRKQLADRVVEMESGKAVRQAAEPTAALAGETLVENNWVKGKVKWFNNDKGYGFISTESNTDVFVHWRDISSWDRSLVQGDEVEFMVTKTAKGFQAINVMKAGKENAAEGQGEGEGATPLEVPGDTPGPHPEASEPALPTSPPADQS